MINQELINFSKGFIRKKVFLIVGIIFLVTGGVFGYYFRKDLPIIKNLIKSDITKVEELKREEANESKLREKQKSQPVESSFLTETTVEKNTNNICFNEEVGSRAKNVCESKPGCAWGFTDLTDPRDGKKYKKVGCDTILAWSLFNKNTPSPLELLKFECRNIETKEECSSLNYCTYDEEIKYCLDINKESSTKNVPIFQKTNVGVDCTKLKPDICKTYGCMIILPNSENAYCENL